MNANIKPATLARTSFLVLALGLSLSPVGAEGETVPTDLPAVEQALQQSTSRQQELKAEAVNALREEIELSDRLVIQAKAVQEKEQALTDARVRLAFLKESKAELALQLASQQDMLSEVLAGLQRLEQNPPPALVVNPHDALEALRSAMMFGAVVPELRQAADTLHAQLAELENLNAGLVEETKNNTQALEALAAARQVAMAMIDEKKAKSESSNKHLAIERERSAVLAEQANSLKQLIVKLAEEKAKQQEAQSKAEAEAQQARLAAEEAERQRLAAPPLAFSLAKGQLPYPAQGQLFSGFGAETSLGTPLDGIVIATQAASQIITPAGGKVEFAGKFRGYGEMLIINPGEGYLLLLAGLGQITATPGQSVKAGEPVGLMGTNSEGLTLTKGLPKQNTPVLYVEFRHNGDPVDPAPWWIGNRKEAMR